MVEGIAITKFKIIQVNKTIYRIEMKGFGNKQDIEALLKITGEI